GERLCQLVEDDTALLAATAIVLLAPSPPLLFMGEEWAAPEPFLYFCDFEPGLAARVREGRKRGSAHSVCGHGSRTSIPDPAAARTFERTRLAWSRLQEDPHARWLRRYRELLAIRHREIVPLIPQ